MITPVRTLVTETAVFVETMKEAALKAGEILKNENVEIKVHQIAPLDICSIPDVIRAAGMEHDGLMLPDKIADTYYHIAQQHRSVWTHELDMRSFSDSPWWNDNDNSYV